MLYTAELADKLKKNIEWISIKANEDDTDFLFDVVATTQDVDRDWEIILVDWRDTTSWEKNPVVLANHEYEIEYIIWKWISFYTMDWVKRLKWVFSKTNPLGIMANELYKEGMLKAVSVWFIPKQRNADNYKIIERAELLEVSFVAVPCNPNAISVDWKLFEEAVAKWLIIKSEEETTPWDRDVQLIPEPPQQWNAEIVENTVTPCEWCECEKCVTNKSILSTLKAMQEWLHTMNESIKSMADKNVKSNEQDAIIESKKILQTVDNALNEWLRQLKQVLPKN